MKRFSQDFKNNLSQAISKAEEKTLCEIIPIITKKSHHYPLPESILIIFFSVIFILIYQFLLTYYFNQNEFIFFDSHENEIFLFKFLNYQILAGFCGALFGFLLSYIPQIERCLISKKEMQLMVESNAYRAFFEHKLHLTKNHSAMLIYFSLFERKIVILTDESLSKTIPAKLWDDLLLSTQEQVKEIGLEKALIELLEQSSNVLAHYFPRNDPKQNSENEHEDQVIFQN